MAKHSQEQAGNKRGRTVLAMNYRKLGNTGLEVSILAFGGSSLTERDCSR